MIAVAAPRAGTMSDLARADSFWAEARRGAGRREGEARPINLAIDGYRAAVAAAPEDLEAHWKLQRALWFAAEFATSDPAVARSLHEQAIDAADAAFVVLAQRAGGAETLASATPQALHDGIAPEDRSDAAHLYFWSAINLGAWSRQAGLLAAVRAGVANRLYEATLRSIALDSSVEQGGAIRLLSRLHSELPRACRCSPAGSTTHARYRSPSRRWPSTPSTRATPICSGSALLSNAPDRRAEAIGLIERTAHLEPRADQLVEDEAIRISAGQLLREDRVSSLARSPS